MVDREMEIILQVTLLTENLYQLRVFALWRDQDVNRITEFPSKKGLHNLLEEGEQFVRLGDLLFGMKGVNHLGFIYYTDVAICFKRLGLCDNQLQGFHSILISQVILRE
ncbi:hypothetical protein Ddye_026543 [Dipteronia dyeriana]|uniref:Uncharacterized protein n=1 Tax=Dipteronia dyeriana TaxID=168575 RepID=A0AAD9WQK5_9ROSI|nr:hypothetical protein Ddye_026543 [Dipteronia dyeriana]